MKGGYMNPDELDKALREFRKEHAPRQSKRRKGRRHKTGMSRLVDCIEQQLDAAFAESEEAPPAGE